MVVAGIGGAAGGGGRMMIGSSACPGADHGGPSRPSGQGLPPGAWRDPLSNAAHGLPSSEGRAVARGSRAAARSGPRSGFGNADLRSTSQGGWCYTEHELFQVFLPLIGPDGGMVYMAMTRLAPLAAVRAELPVTVEALARESCVSRSTAHRKLRELVRLGMVLETRGSSRRPSAYQLVSLRELARVGEPELRRRLAELHSQKTVKVPGSSASGSPDSPQLDLSLTSFEPDPANSGAAAPCSSAAPEPAAAASRHLSPASVSQASVCETPVSQIDAPVSQHGAPVSQPGRAFNLLKKKSEKEDLTTPPTPQGGPGGLASDLDLAALGSEPALHRAARARAARWVLDQSGVSATRRLESLLTRQLQLGLQRPCSLPPDGDYPQDGHLAQPAEDPLQALALRMVQRWRQYLGLCRRQELQFQWGFARFFGEGLWAQPEAWPRRAPSGSPRAHRGAAAFAAAATAERFREPGILRSSSGSCNSAASAAGVSDAALDAELGSALGTERAGAFRAGLSDALQPPAQRQPEEREAEERQAALGYWRRMRQRGVPIYAQEAPLWVRSVLEAEPPALSC